MSLFSILIAFLITAAGLPLARRVALSSGFVEKSSDQDAATGAPYLGGVPVITATLIGGVLIGGGGLGRIAAAVGASAAIGLLGLVTDDRAIGRVSQLVVETVAALVVVVAGIRLAVTGVGALDVALTIVWIVGVTNAFNLLDSVDDLAAGIGGAGAAATFVVAALGGQTQLAHFSGALAAACLGYLAFSRLRPRIRLGNSGSLFIGFALAVAALELQPRVGRSASTLVPILLLALPLLDAAVVVFGRLRRRLQPGERAGDGLVHRLGPSPRAVAVLVGVESFLAALAVFVGRSMLPWGVGLAFAGALLVVVITCTAPVPVHAAPVVGLPRALRLAALGVVVVFVIASAAAGVALVRARGPLRSGADSATAALNAARIGDYQRASVLFADSKRSFSLARSRLEGPLPSLGLVVPVVAPNMRAARLLADVGTELSATGRTMATQVRPEQLRMQGGAVPVAEITRIAPALRASANVMARAKRRIDHAQLPYLVGPVRNAVRLVREKLASVGATTQKAADAAELAPRILGGGQPRRYFLAIQNNAESRATGGFLGNFGELVAANGRVSLVKFGSLDNLRDEGVPFAQRKLDAPADFTKRFADRMPEIKSWAHINITPDFPTVARLIASLYPQSGGQAIDGVISVDAVGLSALLKLTGPVDVAGWPVPLDTKNIVRVTTQDQYAPNITYGQRRDFLGAVAETVWRRVSTSDLGTPYAIANALGPATTGRHIQLALSQPREERFVRELGIAGAVARPRSDALLLVNHNGGGNKVDVYLKRQLDYHVRLDPDANGTAQVTAVVNVRLHNGAPSSGLPVGVLGDSSQPITPGENFSLATVYSPLTAAATLVDDKRYPFRSDADLGRVANSTYLRVAPLSDLKMQMLLTGRILLQGGDTYVLDLAHQARLEGDDVTVSVEVVPGWEIIGKTGLRALDARHASASFNQVFDQSLSLRLRPKGISGLWRSMSK